MKTRSNMPLFVVACSNVKQLTDEQINMLRCGDWLVKRDETGEHAYKVSFKKDGVGMCLTYVDASCNETVSYDYTDGHWVYNSTDVNDFQNANFNAIEVRYGSRFRSDLQIDGDLSVDGDAKLFEKITDTQGHRRFIEFDGTPLTLEGFESVFCKASLSGTHLMFVLAGNIANTTLIGNGTTLAIYDLPEWIMDKIYPVWENSRIEKRSFPLTGDDWTEQNMGVVFQKSDGKIKLLTVGSVTLSANRAFRITFDLLIDND